jgi:hypothetical protein
MILCHGSTTGRGSRFKDPVIEESGLSTLFKRTFATLKTPRGLAGAVKLRQRHDNPDALDLYFYSATDFDPYECGKTYRSPNGIVFERSDFEQFDNASQECRARLDLFAMQLTTGALKPGLCE